MQVFKLADEAEFKPDKHVEKILGRAEDGDFTVACWEPGQISPYHCHPNATEIYFCVEGGGVMRTPRETVAVTPGAFVVHPPGEVHEYANGPARTLCCSASAMAPTCARGTSNGAGAPAGRKAPTMPRTTARIRLRDEAVRCRSVMAGLAPAIHVFLPATQKAWVPGTIGERSDAVLRMARAGHDAPGLMTLRRRLATTPRCAHTRHRGG